MLNSFKYRLIHKSRLWLYQERGIKLERLINGDHMKLMVFFLNNDFFV